MSTSKERLEKSLDHLAEKAENCSDLAKDQRANADEQHEGARRLESLGQALEVDVADIKRELVDVPLIGDMIDRLESLGHELDVNVAKIKRESNSVPNPPDSSQRPPPPKADQ